MTSQPRWFRIVGSLASANFLSMAVAFATNIVITRWMTASSYGDYRLAVNLAVLLYGCVNLGVQVTSARRLAATESPQAQRAILGDGISLMMAVFAGMAGLTATGAIVLELGSLESALVLGCAALIIVPVGVQRFLVYVLRGSRNVAQINLLTVMPPLLLACVWVLATVLESDLARDAGFAVVAYGVTLLIVHVTSLVSLRPKLIGRRRDKWRALLRSNREEGLQVYKGALFGVVAADLASVVVGFTVDASHYAVYALAWSLASPLTQVSVIFQILDFRGQARQRRLTVRRLGLLILVISVCLAIGVVLMAVIKPILYGEEFSGLVLMVGLLGAALVLHGVGDYVNSFQIARGDTRGAKVAAYSTGIAMLIGACIAAPFFGVWGLAVARIIASLVYALVGLSKAGVAKP